MFDSLQLNDIFYQVMEDGCRTAHIALVAVGSKLKYILATENMKAGDIIKTSRHLPRIPGKKQTNIMSNCSDK